MSAPGLPPRLTTLLDQVRAQPGQPPAPPSARVEGGQAGSLSGLRWDDLEIGELVGSGGMGEVYRARQAGTGRIVALKVMHAQSMADEDLRLRFSAEARAAALVRSPHVVGVYASGSCDGRPWLALEYVDGTTLEQELRDRLATGRRFTPRETVQLVGQAALGLAAAHGQRLVHRDLKPANLLLAADGTLKIADFGLVRFLDQRLTRTGTVLGTPRYIAPEQGRGFETDARSDLYSLGVVMYELLTLRPPFDGETAEALIFQHNFAEPELPSRVNPDVPLDVQSVCLKCLQKDPAQRYADAGDLARDLQRLHGGLAPLSAVFAPGELNTGASQALRRLAGWRRRWWSVAAAVAATALAIAAAAWWWDGRKTELAALRSRLAPVALTSALPATAGADAERLAALAGRDDPQVVQARGKLARIEALAADLDRLTSGPPDRPALAAVRSALAAIAGLVGPAGDPRLERWSAWLASAAARSELLRARLAPRLAQADLLDHQLRSALGDDLAAFLALADPADPQSVAWSALIQRTASADRTAVEALAALDAPPPPPAAALPGMLAACDLLARLDPASPGLAARARRLAAEEAAVAGHRAVLARLEAKTGDLDGREARDLAEAVDGLSARQDLEVTRIQRLRSRLAERAAAIDALAGRLAILDRTGPVPAEAGAWLERYAALAGSDDPQAVAWRARLEAARAEQTRLREHVAAAGRLAAAWVLPAEAVAMERAGLADWRSLAGDAPAVAAATARLDALCGPPAPAWAVGRGHDTHGPWMDLAVDGIRQRLRWLPPGSFTMGSPPDEAGRDADEVQVRVRLDHGVWIADRECTQALWHSVMRTRPSEHRGADLPVEQVAAADAESFCRRLGELLPGCAARLPSEAEWEAAMRAGDPGTWVGLDPRHVAAAVVHAGSGGPAPVGDRPANALGLYDGLGNVWEWCATGYGPHPAGDPVIDPFPPAVGRRVARGGSWGDPLTACRVANRVDLDPAAASPYLGFRFVVLP